MSQAPQIALVMGSDSDLPVMEPAIRLLQEWNVPFELRVLSAHRSPEAVRTFATGALARGFKVIIAAAGGAAHLPGVIASMTTLPVIGVPMPTDLMDGVDSLLSMVQMPAGVPVATSGIGKSGATNAAILSVEILALQDEELGRRLASHKGKMLKAVQLRDIRAQRWLKEKAVRKSKGSR